MKIAVYVLAGVACAALMVYLLVMFAGLSVVR